MRAARASTERRAAPGAGPTGLARLARSAPRDRDGGVARAPEETLVVPGAELRRCGRGGALLRLGRQPHASTRRRAHASVLHAPQGPEQLVVEQSGARRAARA